MILIDSSLYPMPESSVNSLIARRRLRAAERPVYLGRRLKFAQFEEVARDVARGAKST
jgi:hypothetical protein